MATKQKKRPSAARKPAQKVKVKVKKRSAAADVVYTPPKPFNRAKLLLGLATAVAVVLALVFSMTIFFKVERVVVTGVEKYTDWAVMQASGIEIGDSLLGISDARAASQIESALPYVQSVRVGIKLPNTVNIEITELDVLYSVKDVYDAWWLVTADGRVVEQVDAAAASDCTKVLGIRLSAPIPGTQAVAAEPAPVIDEAGNQVPVTVTGADQLSAALSILQYLESNGIIGQMVSVDVTEIAQVELWYGQQYQIELGDTTQLNYKIQLVRKCIDQLPEYETGIIDVSFTTMPEPIFTGFET